MTLHVPFTARRSMYAAAWENCLYFYGGVGGATLSESIYDISRELWRFDPATNQFTLLAQAPHAPGAHRCPGFIATEEGLELWGGSGLRETPQGPTHTFRNDWWIFSPRTGRWVLREASQDNRDCPVEASRRPAPRYTPVFGKIGDTYYVFSGYTEDRLGERKLNDMWILCKSERGRAWTQLPSGENAGYAMTCQWPGIRYGSAAVFTDAVFYVFGGFSDEGDHNDLWVFHADSRRWEPLAPDCADGAPLPRYCAARALHDGGFYIFGGRSRQYPKRNYNDCWRFDLHSRQWECLLPQHDEGRAGEPVYHAKCANAQLDGLWYICGGEGPKGHRSDLWTYDFSKNLWAERFPARPDDPVFW